MVKLVFVYNAEAGLLHGIMDSIHKTISPQTYSCDLCAITYGAFAMDKAWRQWIASQAIPAHFYHRADFKTAWPDVDIALPVIMLEQNAKLTPLIAAEEFSAIKTVNGLIALLTARLALAKDETR